MLVNRNKIDVLQVESLQDIYFYTFSITVQMYNAVIHGIDKPVRVRPLHVAIIRVAIYN